MIQAQIRGGQLRIASLIITWELFHEWVALLADLFQSSYGWTEGFCLEQGLKVGQVMVGSF
jgi:hypothetical protein